MIRRITTLFVVATIVLCTWSASTTAQVSPNVGIPSETLNHKYAAQRASQWCWAASIEMVLEYYGVNIDQTTIVKRTYGTDEVGRLPNWPASFDLITANLNNRGVDNDGNQYVVKAVRGSGAPPVSLLVDELAHQHPVIIGYDAGVGGHAVVVTAANVTNGPSGPVINSIVVRDPSPVDGGRKVYSGRDLASRIMAYWIVRAVAS